MHWRENARRYGATLNAAAQHLYLNQKTPQHIFLKFTVQRHYLWTELFPKGRFVAVPRVLEKIHSELDAKFAQTSGIEKPLYLLRICQLPQVPVG